MISYRLVFLSLNEQMSRKLENNAAYEKMLEQAKPGVHEVAQQRGNIKGEASVRSHEICRYRKDEEEEEERTLCIKHRNAFSVSSRSVSS